MAIRAKKQGKQVQPGETVQFIICLSDNPKATLSDKAFSPEEVSHYLYHYLFLFHLFEYI